VGSTCIPNYENAVAMIEYLKSKGSIVGVSYRKDMICIDFTGEVEVTFDDYLQTVPYLTKHYVERLPSHRDREMSWFNSKYLLYIMKTLRGGEVVEYVPGEKIRIKDTEKTEFIGVRLSREEKEQLESLVARLGTTVSDLVRSLIKEKLGKTKPQ